MNTNLSYTGSLILTTRTRNTVTRNHGTQHLFRLLSTLLCKEDFNTQSLPTYLMLYKDSPQNLVDNPYVGNNVSKMLLRNPLEIIRQSNVNSSGVYESTFTATLDSTMLISSATLNTDLTLCLVSGDKTSILAAVEFDLATYNIIADGGQSFIKWVMTVGNNDNE